MEDQQINSDLASSVISGISLLAKFKTEIIKIGKITKDEINQLFDKNLSKYLDNQFDKFYNTKTFLFRDEKVNFYEAFFPVDLKKVDTIIDTSQISFSLLENTSFATIIGNAGTGKTMLMKHFFIHSYKKLFRIPIVIELRHLNDYNGNVIEYIYKVLLENKLASSKKILERVLDSGKFLFLFDGYDEIYSNQKKLITEEIENFVDQYSNNFFVITSRPGADAEALTRFENYYVQELNDNQISNFVKQQLTIIDELDVADKIIDVINKSENRDYVTYLRNPLLLSMFILTFKQYPDLPRSKNKFYWNVFDTLVTKHDSLSKKGGYQHERKTGLQNEDIEKILKWFGYISLFKGKFSFDKQFFVETLKEIKVKLSFAYDVDQLISDLTVSVSLIIIDGLEYKFPHKSFQEYFCACLVKDLDLDSKKKVYSEKFPSEAFRSQSQNNFWNLCIELDKIHFFEFFALPMLDKYISSLENVFTVKRCLEKIGYNILFIYYEDSQDYISTHTVGVSAQNEIVKFFNPMAYNGIFDLQDFYKSYNKQHLEVLYKLKLHNDEVHELSGDDVYFSSSIYEMNKICPDFIKKMKIESKLLIVIKNIKNIVANLKEEIEQEKKQNVSLLDI